MASKSFSFLSLALFAFCLLSFAAAVHVSYDGRALKIDEERRVILSGSIHYPRSTPQMWPSMMKKSREGGLNAIETYVFWNAHEPLRRQYDFSGNLDLVRFIKTIQSEGLYSILRIGPYICGEWNYGGLPVWLNNIPGIKMRTKNQVFMNEMANFTTLIVDMMKRENLFASQGGPIILAQIENEYGNVMWKYGDDGKQYVNWCAKLAQSYQIGVPWIMCQQSDAPKPMINTCNGWYCDDFQPNNENVPKIWTENWTGWFKDWGMQDPHRTAEDLAYSVARFFQKGGTLQNYYMYHGGTNFGRTAGGPYITTSYDYDWGHLKQLHLLLRSMEKELTYGSLQNITYGNSVEATVYTYKGKQVCFLANANQTNDATVTLFNTVHNVPAWSVIILPDCYTEAYNTAKVTAQRSVMVKKANEADNGDEPYNLEWSWRSEPFVGENTNEFESVLTTNKLLDQKVATNDTSDYLWYITSVDVNESDAIWGKDVNLHVRTLGHIIHAFVNGKHVGSQLGQNGHLNFTFEKKINLNLGKNEISLLSVTVGLPNYGALYDQVLVGIHGPVQLIGNKNGNKVVKDLTNNQWTYKIGLVGENQRLYDVFPNKTHKWTNYTPLGDNPVVVDLMGLGKGHAWINGQSIGRYWPNYAAAETGCSYECDYRGAYSNNKYHVPRSFFNDKDNELVLFEELGGSPWNVKFHTVETGSASAYTSEGNTLELSCNGGLISDISFASFGDPSTDSGSFAKGQCESSSALAYIQKECIEKEECSIDVSEKTLGSTGCNNTNSFAVEIQCS
ncbi:hypothetical protein UlMin_000165 [Ulmus minor]